MWLVAPRCAEFRLEAAPPPGHGQLRVRAVASAISQGTEMLVYRGQVATDLPLDLPTLQGSFGFPIKYGYALVGRVIDVGTGVQDWAPGDAAFVLHPHQSALTISAELALHLPVLPDLVHGVFVANLETAVNVLLDTPFNFGETVLIFGQGTVGLLVAQLFRRAGARRVIVVDPLQNRRELALELGVDAALSPGGDLAEEVRYLTGGLGADVAIEASGSGAALQQAIDSVAGEGTVVAVSWYGSRPVTLELGRHFHRGRVRLLSSQVGHVSPALAPRWDRGRRMSLALQLLPQLPLDRLVSHRIPFADAPSALRMVDEHPEEVVQVVLTYDAS